MPNVTVEMPAELLSDLDRLVGPQGPFYDRSEAVSEAIRVRFDEEPNGG